MKVYDAKTSFAGGELSPALYGRIDLEQYGAGARILENFIVLPQGAIINRPGTSKVSNYSYGGNIKLIPFIFSEDDCRVLVFRDKAMDVYSELDFEYSVVSPYSEQQLAKLKYLQSGDVLYLFHPDVPVYMLMRTGGAWKFSKVVFENGPFEDINTDPDKIMAFDKLASGDYTLSAFGFGGNSDLREHLSAGSLIYIERDVNAESFDLKVRGSEWTTVKYVFGPFTYRTSGKWVGKLEVQRCRLDNWRGKSESQWVWEEFKTHKSGKDSEENFSFSGTVEEYANHYRFRYTGDDSPIEVAFSFEGGVINYIFEVVGSITKTTAEVVAVDNVIERESHIETDAWAFGSFSVPYGYPSVGIFHQERLILANTKHSPQSIWMSKPASWHNFGTSIPAKDDDAISVTLASKEINEIRGLASRGDLLIFTAGGEWTARAGSKSDIFTPSSIVITPASYRGSADIPPLEVGEVTLFVQRQGGVVRSIGYSLEVDGYSSQDISILSSHIFEDKSIKAWAYQQTPWSVVWCVLSNHTCAALTLQRDHKVTAWTRQVFDNALIYDVCCIPGDKHDWVYFAVERNHLMYIERLNRRNLVSEAFLDAGQYPVKSVLETLDWETKDNRGTIQGRHKHMPAMTLRLLNTKTLKGCVITENTPSPPLLDELQFPGASSPGEYSEGLFSGDVRLVPQGGVGRTCRVRLENDTANPVEILAIYPEVVIPNEAVDLGDGSE